MLLTHFFPKHVHFEQFRCGFSYERSEFDRSPALLVDQCVKRQITGWSRFIPSTVLWESISSIDIFSSFACRSGWRSAICDIPMTWITRAIRRYLAGLCSLGSRLALVCFKVCVNPRIFPWVRAEIFQIEMLWTHICVEGSLRKLWRLTKLLHKIWISDDDRLLSSPRFIKSPTSLANVEKLRTLRSIRSVEELTKSWITLVTFFGTVIDSCTQLFMSGHREFGTHWTNWDKLSYRKITERDNNEPGS